MSFLNDILGIAIKFANLIKGKSSMSDIIMQLAASLPEAILKAIAVGKLTSVEKLEEALELLDLRTGIDAGAIHILRDLPDDKEEELFDAIKKIAEVLGKNKLKVEGYYTAP